MHKTSLDLVPILTAIETVCNSTLLTPAQRETICMEMHAALPDKMFCPNSHLTLHLIQTILRSKDGSPKPETAKSAAPGKEPKHGKASIKKPSGSTAPNPRRKAKAPANVGKSPK